MPPTGAEWNLPGGRKADLGSAKSPALGKTKGERDSEKCGYCTRENLGKSGENLKIFRNMHVVLNQP